MFNFCAQQMKWFAFQRETELNLNNLYQHFLYDVLLPNVLALFVVNTHLMFFHATTESKGVGVGDCHWVWLAFLHYS